MVWAGIVVQKLVLARGLSSISGSEAMREQMFLLNDRGLAGIDRWIFIGIIYYSSVRDGLAVGQSGL
jgi:hypothetical protein